LKACVGGLPAAVVLSCVVLVCGCRGQMQASELSPSVETLASSAAAGQLLAKGVVEDRTKATFVRAYARELAEDVDHEAEKLNDAVAARGVVKAKQAASTLADEISTALGRMQTGPDDARGARHVEARLGRLARRAELLGRSL
jgi:hypothetical protein